MQKNEREDRCGGSSRWREPGSTEEAHLPADGAETLGTLM